jgi:hypothetical protein
MKFSFPCALFAIRPTYLTLPDFMTVRIVRRNIQTMDAMDFRTMRTSPTSCNLAFHSSRYSTLNATDEILEHQIYSVRFHVFFLSFIRSHVFKEFSVNPSFHLFVYPSICLFIYPFVYPFIHTSICLYIFFQTSPRIYCHVLSESTGGLDR